MSYINENCIYKILPKVNLHKAMQLNESNQTLVLYNKLDNDRYTTDDDAQNWYFVFNEDFNAYKIVNEKTKKILGYEDDNSKNIVMYDLNTDSKNDSLYWHWTFEMMNDGYFIIKNAGDPSRVLDLYGSDGTNNGKIILFQERRTKNQRFRLVRHKFKPGYEYEEAKKITKPYIQKENTYRNFDDLKYKIFNSDQFKKKWANIADMLGFSWCCGTKGLYNGDDFKVTKLDNGNYLIKANYRNGDPFVGSSKPNDRLEMEISNIKLMIDPNSIKQGKASIENLSPTIVSTTNAVNNTSSESTATTEIEYTQGNTISTSTSNSVSNSIGVQNSFKVKVHGMKFEQSFEYNITHEKSWGEQIDQSTETKVKSILSVTVPPKTKLPIYAVLYKSKASFPYEAIATLEYRITLRGILKTENAYKGKPTNRPKISYAFGNSKLSATKHLLEQYSQRDVQGVTPTWDYNWCILNYDADYFNEYMSQAITPDGVEIKGVFTNIDSSNVTISAGEAPDEKDVKIEVTNTEKIEKE